MIRHSVLFAALILAAIAHGQERASSTLGDEAAGLGPVRVPAALPPWIDGDPLAAIARLLEVGDGAAGRELLWRFLRERSGALVLPPGGGPAAIDAPWRVLGRWQESLSAAARANLHLSPELAERELGSGTVDAASPLVWLDGLDALARRRLEEAVESGDRDTAILLSRRAGLVDLVHPEVRAWLAGRAPLPPPPIPAPPPALRLVARASLDLEANPIDDPEERSPPLRRIPLADIHPAIWDDTAVLPGSPSPIIIELGPRFRRLAAFPLPYPGSEPTPGPLRDAGWWAALERTTLALPLRTPRREYSPTTEWIHDPSPWRDRGWSEPGTFRWSASLPDPAPLAATSLAADGFTIGGAPCIDLGVVHWLATRGFDEVETWLFALDAASGKERWRTHLGTISRPWQSRRDLIGLFPEGRIVAHRDELFVVHGGGWVARLGRERGDLRGVLLYPRMRPVAGMLMKWGRHYFSKPAAPRPRYLGEAWVHEGDGAPLLIALPPDARQVLAIDLDGWRIAWSHPVSDQTVLARDPAGVPWCIDLRTKRAERTLHVLALEPVTGRLRDPGSVRLEVPGGASPGRAGDAHSEADLAPIIAGVPILAGGWIAIPLAAGWGLWAREPLRGGPPDRVIPWPEGSMGGTIVPAGDDRWLVIHRADPAWGSRSLVELFEGMRE